MLVSRRYTNSNYELTPLRRVIHKVQYGISLPATEEPIGLPMIRMNNLQNDGWDFTDLKYIELSEEEAEPYLVNPGNILFNRTNSKELVGKCEVFREAGDWVFASYLIRVVLDQTKAIPEFVANFLNAKAGRIQIAPSQADLKRLVRGAGRDRFKNFHRVLQDVHDVFITKRSQKFL